MAGHPTNAEDAQQRYDVVHATRVSSALRELESACFDVVLTDLTLPDAVRLECVDNVRQAYPELPLVVLTLLDCAELACEALQAGTQDFIVKDAVSPLVLDRAIQNAIERQKMVAENARLNAACESAAVC